MEESQEAVLYPEQQYGSLLGISPSTPTHDRTNISSSYFSFPIHRLEQQAHKADKTTYKLDWQPPANSPPAYSLQAHPIANTIFARLSRHPASVRAPP